jgi:four helix bundle protein
MSTIQRFEDIVAWRKARELTRLIYVATKDGIFAKDFGLRDQLRRAAVSVMSNIAEGYERGGDKELIQFLSLAKGSCGEIRSQLHVALDQRYLTEAQFKDLYGRTEEISRLVAGFMSYLKNSGLKGPKYKPTLPP